MTDSMAARERKPIRVVLVDDHAMVRQGIRYRLESEKDIVVVGEAESRESGIALVGQLLPDVVVLDIRLRQDSGIEVAKKLRADHPVIKILILSAYDFDQYVKTLARIGVDGYISKENSQDELVDAIREVMAGGAVLSPRVAKKVSRVVPHREDQSSVTTHEIETDELTLREIEILNLLRDGMETPDIAEHMALPTRVVEAEIAHLLGKLGATTKASAVRAASEAGIL